MKLKEALEAKKKRKTITYRPWPNVEDFRIAEIKRNERKLYRNGPLGAMEMHIRKALGKPRLPK